MGNLTGGYLAKGLGYGVSFGSAALLMGVTAMGLQRLQAAVHERAAHKSSHQ